MPLIDRDRAILDFESGWGRHGPVKEEAIHTHLGLSPARYYQILGRLIDRPEALEYAPMLILRLRRIREARADARRSRVVMRPRVDG